MILSRCLSLWILEFLWMVVVFWCYQPRGCSILSFVVFQHPAHTFANSPFIKFSLNNHFGCASWFLLGSRLKYTLSTKSEKSKNILVAMEHRWIYSILLMLLMRKLRQIDVKGFVQSHQLLCDRLGTRTQIFNLFIQQNPLQKVSGTTKGVHRWGLSRIVNSKRWTSRVSPFFPQ